MLPVLAGLVVAIPNPALCCLGPGRARSQTRRQAHPSPSPTTPLLQARAFVRLPPHPPQNAIGYITTRRDNAAGGAALTRSSNYTALEEDAGVRLPGALRPAGGPPNRHRGRPAGRGAAGDGGHPARGAVRVPGHRPGGPDGRGHFRPLRGHPRRQPAPAIVQFNPRGKMSG